MGKKRTEREWEIKFEALVDMMNILDNYSDNDKIESTCTMLRNPVVFDHTSCSVVSYLLPYNLGEYYKEHNNKVTNDHLIGMSNIVLYIFKQGLNKKWVTYVDFQNTLKALNVTLTVPKYVNDMGTFKKGWKFDYDNVEDCLNWHLKLKSVGINELTINNTKEKLSVDQVWSEWYETNKNYLI
jgi:hypothetical protein